MNMRIFRRRPRVTATSKLQARIKYLQPTGDPKKRLMSFVLDVAVALDRVETSVDLDLIDREPVGFLSAKWKIPGGGGLGMRCYVDGAHSMVSIQAGAVDSDEVELATTYRDRLKTVIDGVIQTSANFEIT